MHGFFLLMCQNRVTCGCTIDHPKAMLFASIYLSCEPCLHLFMLFWVYFKQPSLNSIDRAKRCYPGSMFLPMRKRDNLRGIYCLRSVLTMKGS